MSRAPIVSLIFVVLSIAACTPAPDGVQIHDPFEAQNRDIHAFNVALDRAFVRGASGVSEAAPEELTQPIVNFADNVGLPGAVLNGLLQGDIGGAATNTMRFVINSTVGVFGLLDPAGAIGLAEEETDFGETLYVWGLPEGAYVELPFYGPSTERDAVGRIVDAIIDPLGRVGSAPQLEYGGIARVAGQVVERGRLGDTLDDILYESADSYAQARLIYLQNRRFELGDEASTTDESFVDPFEDF